MNKKVALLVSVLFVFPDSTYSQAKSTQSTRALLQSIFEEATLPITISYSETIDDSVSIPDFETIMASEDTSVIGKIGYDEFTRLFKNLDSLTLHNIWSLEELDKKSKRDYYETYHLRPTTFFQVNKKIYAFVMEIIKKETGGSEQLLFTIDDKGDIIEKLPIAFYTQAGTYTGEDGERLPWWPTMYAILTTSYLIEKYDE